MKKILLICIILLTYVNGGQSNTDPKKAAEQICGEWETIENNLIVRVFKENNSFQAKIVWFNIPNHDSWTDKKNPDIALRSRKVIGMSVLKDLSYQPETNSWENGTIYDAKNGREWNASAYIDKAGLLKVKGYWHFKFIGRTLTFRKLVR